MSTDPIHHHQGSNATASSITVILVISLLVFFFVLTFSFYFCRCFMEYMISSTWLLHRTPSGNPVAPQTASVPSGLDPSIVSSFPTFVYSAVKDLRQDTCGLECAVCLTEFEDEDVLRLLTVCNHVFHPECIDLWFGSHKTCPVCRKNLDPSEKSPEKSPIIQDMIPEVDEHEGHDPREETYSIVIKEEEEEGRGRNGTDADAREGRYEVERFSRSHSTGHSILFNGGEDHERFTLRLQENVKVSTTRGHSWTTSCITFGDFSSNVGKGGLGELSGFSGGDVTRV
ncbi:hypothetical protein HHK36_028490 [Tetracentron sinense]|uniref:RING-type E3 ubiquitin transferase n=1 Tax=Tetracentron sinense TaxID=13715 RepID=A0A835D3I3_TETSI|nr:hypothetical protein HHK36_028490 [Tetracentron sinense]